MTESELAAAVHGLTAVMEMGPFMPQRCQKAVDLVIDDSEFSDGEAGDIMCIFAENISIADTYVGIKKKEVHSSFLRSLLTKYSLYLYSQSMEFSLIVFPHIFCNLISTL